MSIGLLLKAKIESSLVARLAGKARSSEAILQRMGGWCEAYCADLQAAVHLGVRDERPTLFCRLHPAAEDLELSLVDSNHFTANANTSTVGPGYHMFVCEMLHRLGEEFRAVWQDPTDDYCDETGYFHSGERGRVFEEMTAWLEALAGSFFDGTLPAEEGPIRLALPLDFGFQWDARALTPMGPRDTEWLERTARDGKHGRDFFAWWTPGLNAEYFRGRALASMWSDVRWRAPLNDFERKNLRYVASSLETAHELDPTLEYPWAEWAVILDLLEERYEDHNFVRIRARSTEPTIGYRRRNVTMRLPGNWWITVPGSFSEFLDDGEALCAQDTPRGVWYTGYAFTGDLAQSFADWRLEMLAMDKDLLQETKDYIAAGKITPGIEEGEEYFALTTSNVCPTGRCICTIVFSRLEERDWAVRVWKSLQPPTR